MTSQTSPKRPKGLLAIGIIGLLALATWAAYRPQDETISREAAQASAPMVEVAIPASLPAQAEAGKTLYDSNCAACHGVAAAGQAGVAPPLIHKIYEPSHHGDIAFQMAAQNGVRAHHWTFGDMPPIAGVTQAQIDAIVAYVRALQRENGIH